MKPRLFSNDGWCAASAPYNFLQGQVDQGVQEGRELYPRGLGPLGEEAGGGHAGDGVGFQDKDVLVPDHHIGAGIAPAAQGLMRGEGALLGASGQLRIESGRADFLGGPGLVLGLVIKKGVGAGRDDFHQGQGLQPGVAQHPPGHFDALDEFLHQHPGIQGEGRGQSG